MTLSNLDRLRGLTDVLRLRRVLNQPENGERGWTVETLDAIDLVEMLADHLETALESIEALCGGDSAEQFVWVGHGLMGILEDGLQVYTTNQGVTMVAGNWGPTKSYAALPASELDLYAAIG